MFYKDERLAIFIDGSNLYASSKALEFEIDYKLLKQEFMRRGKLLRAFYYTALLENDEYSPIRPLVDWLNYNGFTMVTKAAKEYTDSMGRRKVKGNMDIELAVDAMELAPRLDHIVLFSGDGDFRPLIESLQRQGVRVSVVSTIRSQPPMISDELRRQADNFITTHTLINFYSYLDRASLAIHEEIIKNKNEQLQKILEELDLGLLIVEVQKPEENKKENEELVTVHFGNA